MNKNSHRIWLVRHGESQSNVDSDFTKNHADHAVELTSRGQFQAMEAGIFLKEDLPKSKIFLWSSPFTRAKQTARRISQEINDNNREIIYRETPLLAEIDLGIVNNFSSKEEWGDYKDFFERAQIRSGASKAGRFWSSYPGGESQADVAARVQQFFTDIYHTENEINDEVIHHVVVAHGVSIRAFIHMWTFKEIEWWATFSNPENCSVFKINSMTSGDYIFYPQT